MQLTTSQRKIVKKLIDAFDNREKSDFVSFKAPTGAGKTFMASEFISKVFTKELGNNKKTIFIVATISSAKLPKQFAKKLTDYKKYHEFNNYKIEYIKSPTSGDSIKRNLEDIKDFVLEDNKVFVFGISSFGKNTLFYQNNTLDRFLEQAKALNYQIFFIRDEAHIGSKKEKKIGKKEQKDFDEKVNNASEFTINMTATPKNRINLIVMNSSDMEEDGLFLLKTNHEKTNFQKLNLNYEVSNDEIIDDAIETFIESKKEYQSLKSILINPALLIQVMNETDYKNDPIKNKLFNETLNILEKKLQNKGLYYLKYLNNSAEVIGAKLPNTLEYASQIDSKIDVIIFKVGPATGWDIPRANMLLQLRNVSSESLNMQTIGRIMRNPYLNLERNDTTDKYYIWSNYQKQNRDQAFYKLKDKFIEEKFISGRIDQKNKKIIGDDKQYIEDILSFIKSPEFINKLKDFNPIEDIIYNKTNYDSHILKNKIPNYIYLKIYNINKKNDFENKFKLSLFEDILKNISNSLKINIEIIWYVFLSFNSKFNDIKNKNSKWIHDPDPYYINNSAKTQEYYSVWKDNKNTKYVNTSDFKNYGYIQISDDENIQFLDSNPEKKFYENFKNMVSQKQIKEILFFAKMPTLGSQVYFEYYSNIQGKISKSYMDFVIKYKEKIIMVEVKSKNEDYNELKTEELLTAYKIYMEKFTDKNFSLIVYQYDGDTDTNYTHAYIDNNWKTNLSFRDLFDSLFV